MNVQVSTSDVFKKSHTRILRLVLKVAILITSCVVQLVVSEVGSLV